MLEAEGAQFSSCTRPPDPGGDGGALIGLLSFLCVLPSTHARLVFEKKEIQARLIWKEGRKMKLHPYTGDTVGIHDKIQGKRNHEHISKAYLRVDSKYRQFDSK